MEIKVVLRDQASFKKMAPSGKLYHLKKDMETPVLTYQDAMFLKETVVAPGWIQEIRNGTVVMSSRPTKEIKPKSYRKYSGEDRLEKSPTGLSPTGIEAMMAKANLITNRKNNEEMIIQQSDEDFDLSEDEDEDEIDLDLEQIRESSSILGKTKKLERH